MGVGGNHDPESGHRIDWHATMEDVVSAERMTKADVENGGLNVRFRRVLQRQEDDGKHLVPTFVRGHSTAERQPQTQCLDDTNRMENG